jgi:hypothetical protein
MNIIKDEQRKETGYEKNCTKRRNNQAYQNKKRNFFLVAIEMSETNKNECQLSNKTIQRSFKMRTSQNNRRCNCDSKTKEDKNF